MLSSQAAAHSFGQVYNLPVPVWMYLYGAVAALGLSFLVSALFLGGGKSAEKSDSHSFVIKLPSGLTKPLAAVGRLLALLVLLSCVLTGWYGTHDPYGNLNMTLFWIVFVLAFAWFCALFGDIYSVVNPWRTLTDCLTAALPQRYRKPLLSYPPSLQYWPALLLYMGFIWLELFHYNNPQSLAHMLLAYTALCIAGSVVFGRENWFRYCEFFAVFFHLFGKMAILDVRRRGAPVLRMPFSGCSENNRGGFSLLLFLLFMLSSTAFDGIHETTIWLRWFWIDSYPLFEGWAGETPLAAYAEMRAALPWWQSFWLVASPFVYAGCYVVALLISKLWLRNELSLMTLADRFAFSLLPIALVYHFTHYYTLLQTQGIKLLPMLSDPLGRGDNWFGTAEWFRGSWLPVPETVWHTQVLLIVLGHVISVIIAHAVALRLFSSRREAAVSQIPMLTLMMAFTASGLWILSQPIKPPV